MRQVSPCVTQWAMMVPTGGVIDGSQREQATHGDPCIHRAWDRGHAGIADGARPRRNQLAHDMDVQLRRPVLRDSRRTPARDRTIDPGSQASTLYDVPTPPNLLIASGPEVAIWRVPLAPGSYAMRRLEQQRLTIWPPVMRLPDHGWIFCTAPTKQRVGLADVELVSDDAPVLAPPSRGPNGGRLRWLWSPRFPAVPLPEAEPVLAALAIGSMDELRVAGAADEHPDVASGPTEPARTRLTLGTIDSLRRPLAAGAKTRATTRSQVWSPGPASSPVCPA